MKHNLYMLRLIVLVLLFMLFIPIIALAGGDDITQSNDMNNQTAGDVLVGGDSSRALGLGFSHSLGDVDIANRSDCLASTSKSNIFRARQGLVYSPWCMANQYQAMGAYHMAALMRCAVPDVRVHFQTDGECVAANTFIEQVVQEVPRGEPEQDEDEDVHEQQALQHDADIDALTARLEALESAKEEPRQTIVQREEFLSEDRRERLRAIRDEE